MEKSKKILNNILTIQYLRKEIKMNLEDMIVIWLDWIREDIYLLTISSNSSLLMIPLKEKIKGFIKYLCKNKNLDPNFYKTLAERELD